MRGLFRSPIRTPITIYRPVLRFGNFRTFSGVFERFRAFLQVFRRFWTFSGVFGRFGDVFWCFDDQHDQHDHHADHAAYRNVPKTVKNVPKSQIYRKSLKPGKTSNGRQIARMARISTIFGPNESSRCDLFLEKKSKERNKRKVFGKFEKFSKILGILR